MAYMDMSDETLVLLTLAGNDSAYEALVRRHEKSVRAAAYAVIRNPHIAEDATQDAFCAAWIRLNMLREPEKFGAWVGRIARNCAANMAGRFRNYLSLEDIEYLPERRDTSFDPEEMLLSKEESDLVQKSLERLPDRAKQVVYLHYYKDMDAREISFALGISEGTVKWQLHDGRKRMRKELSAMDENLNDTLLQKVMKKVAELKLWDLKNSKAGFEADYRSILKDIDELSESSGKYHALADVLMRGYWWLPGEVNDNLFARIKEAAELGKNEDVMFFVMEKENSKYWGEQRAELIRDVQIPKLLELGLKIAAAKEWINVSGCYEWTANADEARKAYDNAISLLGTDNMYYHFAARAKDNVDMVCSKEFVSDARCRNDETNAYEIRSAGGELRLTDSYAFANGDLYSINYDAIEIIKNAFYCDRRLCAYIKPGESHTASDGSVLSFVSDCETVKTLVGDFTGCELWQAENISGHKLIKTYYKRGTGIVRQEITDDGITEARSLCAYNVDGGADSLIPMRRGNFWEYSLNVSPEFIEHTTRLEVAFADSEKAILTQHTYMKRHKYDENSWLDMVLKIRSEYLDENDKVVDMRDTADRAMLLAKTPMEKAHAKAAASVVRRIMETDEGFNPETNVRGVWNFFSKQAVRRNGGALSYIDSGFRWSFEYKVNTGAAAEMPVLCNDIYEILFETTGAVWSDEWKPGYSEVKKLKFYGDDIESSIVCEDVGEITCPAGRFKNCIKLTVDCTGYSEGMSYCNGKKAYYFAPNVGLVRFEVYGAFDTSPAAYELTVCKGGGEGYMPFEDGMVRRYDATNLTDGYIAAAEYTYVKDDASGDIIVFEDKTGVRDISPRTTTYGGVYSEIREQILVENNKPEEANDLGGYNNFMILYHELTRFSHGNYDPLLVAEWRKHKLRLCEAAGGDSGVPEGLIGYYSRICLKASAALFGGGRKEEGYEYLDKALDYLEKWVKIPEGEKLSVGNPFVFSDIRYIKNLGYGCWNDVIELKDGTRRKLQYNWLVMHADVIYQPLIAKSGWEWFDSVREEPRYKEAVERAKKIMEMGIQSK